MSRNPFFPNSSIAGIFLAMLLLFLIPFLEWKNKKWLLVLLLSVVLFLSALLVLSNSRAGWLGVAAGGSFIIYLNATKQRKRLFVFSSIIVLPLLFLLLFFYKKDSTAGRKHIYSISLKMLRDNWVSGIGIGKFKARFNEYQADYFSTHSIDNKRALLADNTFYAFNDYLQWITETGIIGLLVLVLLIYLSISRIIFLLKNSRPIIIATTSALICVAVAALFSYPLQVLPIQGLVLVCLSVIAFQRSLPTERGKLQRIISLSYTLFIVVMSIGFIAKLWNDYSSKKMEKEAFNLARSGYKTEAINQYKQLVEKHPGSGYNYFHYAQQLYYTNQLPAAYETLTKGMLYYVDNKVYKLKADIEQELRMYAEAEKSYLRTIYMVPNRMGSRVDLLNFYINRNDTMKALYWAKSIINMPIKVPSERIDKMLLETKVILKNIQP